MSDTESFVDLVSSKTSPSSHIGRIQLYKSVNQWSSRGGQTKNGLGRKDMVKSKIYNRLDYRAITFDCRRRAFDINCVASDEDEDGSLFEVSGFLIFCSEYGRLSGIWVELSFELSCHQRLGRKACKAHILLWRHREVLWPSFAFSCGVCLKMNPLPRRYKMLSCVR